MSVDTSVNFAGVSFANPLLVASGTFGFGREYSDYLDLGALGGICVKGLTPQPRPGNPPPRIAETPMGMLNSVGLQNPGLENFISEEIPFLRQFPTRIIANISADTVEDYAAMALRLRTADIDMIEVNISCPNVKAGGLAFGTRPDDAAAVTRAVRDNALQPVMVKLSPNVTDITEIARAVEAAGADALSLINTLLGMRIDLESRRPILRRNVGGLSGPAVFPVAVRMVWQVANAVNLPILGMGGVSSGADALELMMAGADLVAMGTILFRTPDAPVRALDEMCRWAEAHGVSALRDLTGGVRPHTT